MIAPPDGQILICVPWAKPLSAPAATFLMVLLPWCFLMVSDRIMVLINSISGIVATSSRMVSVCMASSFAVLTVLISREDAKCNLFYNWLYLFGIVLSWVWIVAGIC